MTTTPNDDPNPHRFIAPHGQDKPDVELDDEQLAAVLIRTRPDDKPLVYTSKGNLPASILQYRYGWLDNDAQTTFIEQYLLRGEIVKQSVHNMLKQGEELRGIAAAIAGAPNG